MQTERILALGFFDGVHLGHGALLRRVKERSLETGLPACALSFDTHPSLLLRGASVPLLSSAESRSRIMRSQYGLDEVIFAHFDRAMLEMPWRTFVEDYLLRELHAAHVVCGTDFRFGCRGLGTAELLQNTCAELGVGCDVLEKVHLDGEEISSTRIRALLAQGNAEQAVRYLGHPYALDCAVISVSGEEWTLSPLPGLQIPGEGRYCGALEGVPAELTVAGEMLRVRTKRPLAASGAVRAEFLREVRP